MKTYEVSLTEEDVMDFLITYDLIKEKNKYLTLYKTLGKERMSHIINKYQNSNDYYSKGENTLWTDRKPHLSRRN